MPENDCDIEDLLCARMDSFVKYIKDSDGLEHSYEYLDNTLMSEENTREECESFFEEDIINPIMRSTIIKLIDWYKVMHRMRDYFGWEHIVYCRECETWWCNDGEEECNCGSESESEEEPVQTVDPVEESSDDPSI